ncbi:hypothetical protein C8K30_108277 [Promicromonospora sp. AC04]|nr:hypothetical protein C8K30_108277 [Promicromonospora sp. AC04]
MGEAPGGATHGGAAQGSGAQGSGAQGNGAQGGPTSGAEPVFSPDAHRLDLGRVGAITLLVGIVLTGPLAWACVQAVVTDPDPAAKGIAGFFGLLFGGLCLLFLGSYMRVTRPRGIVIDVAGIWFWHGRSWDLIRWTQAARVGLSYETPPELPTIGGPVDHLKAKVSGWLKDKIYAVLRVTDKRGIALEIVPMREEELGELPRLLRYRAKDPAPTPGMPPVLWRVRLPAGYHSFEKFVAAGERFGGHTWEGWFRRQWSGGAGRGARLAE